MSDKKHMFGWIVYLLPDLAAPNDWVEYKPGASSAGAAYEMAARRYPDHFVAKIEMADSVDDLEPGVDSTNVVASPLPRRSGREEREKRERQQQLALPITPALQGAKP